MSAIIGRFRAISQALGASRHIPWVKVPPPSQDTVILFQRPTPWWAKWAHPLVALDVMLMGCIVEYTWDIGGYLAPVREAVRDVKAPDVEEQPSKKSDSLAFLIFDNIQGKSAFKKTIFSGIYLISGITFAAGLLAVRARLVRSVIVQRGNAQKRTSTKVYLQAACHPMDQAVAFPQNQCTVVKGDMNSRLGIRVKGHGAWTMMTNGSVVDKSGLDASKLVEHPKITFLRAWRKAGGSITP